MPERNIANRPDGRWRRIFKRLGQALCAGAARISLFPPPPDTGPLARDWRHRTVADALRADAEKLRGDWQQVGEDLRRAMAQYDADLPRPPASAGNGSAIRSKSRRQKSGRGRGRR